MTAGTQSSATAGASGAMAYRLAGPGLRLVRLHMVSRRAPAALGLLAGFGVLLATALRDHWTIVEASPDKSLVTADD